MSGYNIFARKGSEEIHIFINGRVDASSLIDQLLDLDWEVESDMWDAYCGKYE